jgi:DNA-binding NarL/FixJ family response regulator
VSVALEDLAESLKPIAEHFGVEAAGIIVRHFGGTEIWVPKTWREGHPLNVLGADLARRLCEVFGGEHLPIPRNLMSVEARQREVLTLAATGEHSVAQIALEVGLTERQVYRVLARGNVRRRSRRPVDPRQGTLFS